jgi:hypothetical protein
VVVLVAGVLAGVLIEMGYSFLAGTTQQRNFYGDHVSVADYVQAVKGRLIQANIDYGAVVHGRGLFSLGSEIDHVSDLVLDEGSFDLASFDAEVGSRGQGRQRVNVNVFDVHYHASQLQDSVRNDSAQMKILPAPINAIAGKSVSSSAPTPGESEGDALDPETGSKTEAGFGDNVYPWERFGAYVIRVRLYNAASVTNHWTLERTAEEAFYQVLSPDAAP